MNDLTERLRIAADNLDHYSYPCVRSDRAWIAESCRLAADALEAAEAKLAAIDALHRRAIFVGLCDYCARGWPCETHCILHSDSAEDGAKP